jgi:hypothetical protein
MAHTYTDGDYTVAAPNSLPVFEQPFDGVAADYILRQTWFQLKENKTPIALNTAHPDYADYKLVKEGPETDLGGGVVEWERIYAKVPTSYDEPAGNFIYQFPGFIYNDAEAIEGINPRPDAFSKTVPLQLEHDFFLVGPGETYETWQEIPRIAATKYHIAGHEDWVTTVVGDSPPLATATSPSRAEYEALIAADEATDDSFSIVVEESKVERWMGNIYRRDTLRVKAI